MLVSALFLIVLTLGGVALTYLVFDDERLMWRIAAGNVAGCAVFGTLLFALSFVSGFGLPSIIAAVILTLCPLLIFQMPAKRKQLNADIAKAKGRLQGGTADRFVSFGYYAFFLIVIFLFFEQVMYTNSQGIFTGGSQNLGDLPFHLGAIFGFTDGANFPPQNPSFAGTRFSYPFIADMLAAAFVKAGADVRSAMVLQDTAWAMSLLVIIERFCARVTGSRLAGRIAPALFFFSGGLGFAAFFSDYWAQNKGLWEFLWTLPRDYTIGDHYRWGNSLVSLLMTQRSLLLGLPLTMMALLGLWGIFTAKDTGDAQSPSARYAPAAILGLLAGTLPLIHLHSLMVLFIVTLLLLLMRARLWISFVAFGIGVSIIAVPELIWSVSGSGSDAAKFFSWHFGWDKGNANIAWFWLKNAGLAMPLIAVGIYLWLTAYRSDEEREGRRSLLLFYIPFLLLFVISNAAKLAPWEWDNIKVLIYWFVGSLPFIAFALAWLWEKARPLKALAAVLLVTLVLSGALDVWRVISGQIKIRVFDSDAVKVADQIKAKTPANALFLNAPTYNSAVVLSGRQSLMRYTGHLSSHGIDYAPREADVRNIYRGGGTAPLLLSKYDIDYVLISPDERNSLAANEDFFRRFPVVAESGQYRVYKVK
ncbi:MAG: hypothetical protein IT172_08440 [Acidobacteria bacterium]|nr:hypothetical protein [Acidobacteriota bacterium]